MVPTLLLVSRKAWAMTGTSPGPIFAQLGTSMGSAAVLLVAALVGTWPYRTLRETLP